MWMTRKMKKEYGSGEQEKNGMTWYGTCEEEEDTCYSGPWKEKWMQDGEEQ